MNRHRSSAPPSRRLRCFLQVAVLLTVLSATPLVPRAARADDEDRKGLLGGLQDVLSFRSPSEAFLSARRMSSAEDALPIMKRLAEQGGDGATAARASLWLGHYSYGAGWIGDALAAFRDAWREEAEDAIQSEARFWVLHCENLLESAERTRLEGPTVHRTSDVLAALAVGDRALRGGDPERALQLYLEQEGAAERLGCLGPVYYRLALLRSIGGGRAPHVLDVATLQSWEAKVAGSPERALVAAFETVAPAAASNESEEFADAPDSSLAPSSPPSHTTPDDPRSAISVAEEWAVQLGAYRDREVARTAMEQLTQRGLSVRLDKAQTGDEGEWFRIRLGRVPSREAAQELAERLCQGIAYELVKVAPQR